MKLKQTGKLAPRTKPWQLIRDAVADLKKQEKTKSVLINMGNWHQPHGSDGKCRQCLAGCVISRRLGVDMSLEIGPSQFSRSVAARLHALDSFREGQVQYGLYELGLGLPYPLTPDRDMPGYDSANPQPFHAAMLDLADVLETSFDSLAARARRVNKP